MEKMYSFASLDTQRQQDVRNKIRDAKTPYAELEDLAKNYTLPQDVSAELNNALKAHRHEARTKRAGNKLWSSTNRY